jgi:serine/threonine protein kinase
VKSEIVTHFKILAKLGSGGMWEVYKAVDLKLNRPVALKFLSSSLSFNPEQRKRFLNRSVMIQLMNSVISGATLIIILVIGVIHLRFGKCNQLKTEISK